MPYQLKLRPLADALRREIAQLRPPGILCLNGRPWVPGFNWLRDPKNRPAGAQVRVWTDGGKVYLIRTK